MRHDPFNRWDIHPIGCDCPGLRPPRALSDGDVFGLVTIAGVFAALAIIVVLHLLFGLPGPDVITGSKAVTTTENISAAQLLQFIERVERLEEEKRAFQDDIKDVFAEAKSTGFDVKTMKQIIRLRAMEKHHRDEADALLETYRNSLGLA